MVEQSSGATAEHDSDITLAHEHKADGPALRRVVVASMAGTVVEWYEFFLYGTAATLVFGQLFFPNSGNPLDGIIAAFATYAVGFLSRPLGGIIFGHIGDRLGRKKLLQISLVLIGAATFLMGCLPGFAEIGYWAPALLVLLRFFQGIAVGGEWGGAVLLVAEHCPNKSRGFWGAWPQAGVPLGNLLATVVLLVLNSTLSDEAFLSWGWRVAFWLSAVVVVVGYYIRTKVTDSPTFEAAREAAEKEAHTGYGVVEVMKRYPGGVFTAMGLRFVDNIVYYIIVTFSLTYLTFIGVSSDRVLVMLLIGHALHFAFIPVAGRWMDIIGRKPVYTAGIVLSGLWPFIAFPMFDTQQDWWILAAILIGLFAQGLMYAGHPAIMAELFPTTMRYSGVSLGYQATAIVAGSWAPLIATSLLNEYDSWIPIGIYVAAAGAISLIAAFFLKETKGTSLVALDAEERRRARQRATDAREMQPTD